MMRTPSVKALLCQILVLCTATRTSAQCPNTLAVYNPQLRSICVNATYFIVPVDKATVQKAVKKYNLLPLPTSDKALFPNGFPAGKHPVLTQISYQNDIRMGSLQLMDPLLGASISVPYVDGLADGRKIPFIYPVKQYLGGVNGKDISALVPAVVASLGGTTAFVATFDPNNAAYKLISSSPAEYSAQTKKIIVPNIISGPGIIPEALDMQFNTSSHLQYTSKTFHNFISQPLILPNGWCQRNPIYFNQTFTDEVFRNGIVRLYEPGGAFKGVYEGAEGYSASGVQLGYNSETCASAAVNADPKAQA